MTEDEKKRFEGALRAVQARARRQQLAHEHVHGHTGKDTETVLMMMNAVKK